MRHIIATTDILILFAACKHDDNEPIRKYTSFQVDSAIVIAENPTAILTPANLSDTDPSNDYPVLTITASGSQGESIKFTLISPSVNFTTGEYTTATQGNSMTLGFKGVPVGLLADYNHGGLDFHLYKIIDSTTFEATFFGTLVDTTGTISNKSVMQGFIRASLKKDTI